MERGAQLLTVAEAAAALRLGRTLVYELVLRGELKSLKIGRARRVPMSAVEAFIHERLGASDGRQHPATTQQGALMRGDTTHVTQKLGQPRRQQNHYDHDTSTMENADASAA